MLLAFWLEGEFRVFPFQGFGRVKVPASLDIIDKS